ncbi:hypothetical protein [Streptobacillus notomytis]|uniref:hypothetical protein n=1 Tax=Streptobacillus notomytis TaxID=1712031 RepID=UPI000936948F|nr:hypothetical protein [Streptobacillus notomytis]
MYKTKFNIMFYILSFIPVYFLFTLDSTNSFGNIINKMVAVVMFLLTLRMLYLEVLKIKNKMKFTKVGYDYSFAYGFYFLATLALILGVYFKNLDTLKLGMFLHVFGSSLS